MYSKKILSVCLAVLILASLTGCDKIFRDKEETPEIKEEQVPPPEPESEPAGAQESQTGAGERMRETVFYFVDSSDELVPAIKEIKWVTGIARAAVAGLVDSEQLREELADKDLKPPLPEGTEVLGLTIRDGLAKIDFNENFLNNPNKKAERNAVKAIVYTLTEFSTVDRVQIMINGKIIDKMPFGTQIGKPLTRNSIAAIGSGDGTGFPITLYFAPKEPGSSQEAEAVVPVMARTVSTQKDVLVRDVIEQLIAGPGIDDPGAVAVFPEGTRLLGCKVDDGLAVLTFSKELADYGSGIAAEEAIVKSIVFTLTRLPGIEKVLIKVDGLKDYLPEGTYIGEPFAKDAD